MTSSWFFRKQTSFPNVIIFCNKNLFYSSTNSTNVNGLTLALEMFFARPVYFIFPECFAVLFSHINRTNVF